MKYNFVKAWFPRINNNKITNLEPFMYTKYEWLIFYFYMYFFIHLLPN